MKKFMNDPEHFVDEMIEGILEAHPQQLTHLLQMICDASLKQAIRKKVK